VSWLGPEDGAARVQAGPFCRCGGRGRTVQRSGALRCLGCCWLRPRTCVAVPGGPLGAAVPGDLLLGFGRAQVRSGLVRAGGLRWPDGNRSTSSSRSRRHCGGGRPGGCASAASTRPSSWPAACRTAG